MLCSLWRGALTAINCFIVLLVSCLLNLNHSSLLIASHCFMSIMHNTMNNGIYSLLCDVTMLYKRNRQWGHEKASSVHLKLNSDRPFSLIIIEVSAVVFM